MIGLDTNVLVRYLMMDDPEQSEVAADLIERSIARGESLFVPQVVLCELVWVLSYAYRIRREEIVSVLHQLRRAAQLTLEGADEVRRAIEAFTAAKGDFADYLIAERCSVSGCSTVATFDRGLHSDTRFVNPPAVR